MTQNGTVWRLTVTLNGGYTLQTLGTEEVLTEAIGEWIDWKNIGEPTNKSILHIIGSLDSYDRAELHLHVDLNDVLSMSTVCMY